jgi:predicted ATPase/DNA-binding CsgD family transcriptional regulator
LTRADGGAIIGASSFGFDPRRETTIVAPAAPHESQVDLPLPPTRLVGREPEVAALRARLLDEGQRLLTLTGPGGVGKTRLAIAVAAAAADHFLDGTRFVALAAVNDPALVLPAVAQALGVRETGEATLFDRLTAAFREQRVLLVLDNLEQVVRAAPVVAELLDACPGLAVLATSRVRLHLPGEIEYAVPPLALPGDGRDSTFESAAESPAVRLFVERGRAVRPDFGLTEANAAALVGICRRLDGLPLALELAAARVKVLPLPVLLARLERALPLLTEGARDLPARQRTMRDAVAWSYDLLTTEEQSLIRRLAVFAGGFTVEAAEYVDGQTDRRTDEQKDDVSSLSVGPEGTPSVRLSVLDRVGALVDKSLVRRLPEKGVQRFEMLETIREFAADELARSGEREPRERHAAYFLALAERAERAYWGEAPGDWQVLVEPEYGNLRAALVWSTEHGETETALRLASVLFDPLWVTGELAREQGAWVRRALGMPGGSPVARVKALTAAAWLAQIRLELAEGRRLAEQALQMARSHDDATEIAGASYVLGVAAFHAKEMAESRRHLEEAIAGFRALNSPGRLGWALCYLASLDSRDAVDEGGDAKVIERAIGYCEEALRLFRGIDQRRGVVRALHGLAYLAYKLRDLPRALTSTQQILALDWEERRPTYHYLEDIADVAGRIGRPELAGRLYGAADAERVRLGIPVEPVHRDEYERDLNVSRDALGERAFAAAWAVGHDLPRERAIAEALAIALPVAATAGADPVVAHGLSRREAEVLRLLAEGRTDRQIAAVLFVSRRTVEGHVAHVLAKLGVSTREDAAAVAKATGIVTPQRTTPATNT